MRRIIQALISASITFVIGISVPWVRSYFFPREVSLCGIAHNPQAYDGQWVRVEALGSVVSSEITQENYIIIGERGCTAPDYAWAIIKLDPEVELSAEVDEFVNSATPEIRNATVVVEGRFDQWASMGCYSPQFGIESSRVTLRSPVTSEPLPSLPNH